MPSPVGRTTTSRSRSASSPRARRADLRPSCAGGRENPASGPGPVDRLRGRPRAARARPASRLRMQQDDDLNRAAARVVAGEDPEEAEERRSPFFRPRHVSGRRRTGSVRADRTRAMRGQERPAGHRGGRSGAAAWGRASSRGTLAVCSAQLGKSVVLVDGDATGGNLCMPTSGSRPARQESPSDPAALAQSLVSTSIPGLSILPAPHDAVEPPLALRAGRKVRWLARLRALPAEYLIIDVGPGHGAFALDVMAAAADVASSA